MADPLATVIIPNYNGLRYLPRLMASLAAQSDRRFIVTVVNDCSSDDSVGYLEREWPDVRVMRNAHNVGFAGSCNAGLHAARSPLVVLLNNDTHVDVAWFARGIAPFDDPAVAAVASLVLLAEPPQLIDTAGDIYSIAGGAVKRNHLEARESAESLPAQAFSPCGASAFYRRDAVAEVGFLDELFESYYEDVNLGFRLAWAGHRCVLARDSICFHHLSSSYKPTSWRYHFNSARNAEIVWWSHMSPRLRRRHLPAHLFFLALQGLAEARRGRTICFVSGKWTVLRHVGHIRRKRRADVAVTRVTDAQLDALMVQDWWGLHVGPRIKKLLGWMRPRMISVLTVNYRSSSDLAELARSLREFRDGLTVELIVTNNSPEDPIDLPSDGDLRIDVQNSHNVGYAAGINLAAARAQGDHFFVANPDVCVTRGALRGAVNYLDERPDVGVVLPMLLNPDGTIQRSIRRLYTWPVVLYARSPLRAILPPPAFFRHHLYVDVARSRPSEVDWGIGAAMFMRRRDAGDTVFDSRFFMYFEDVDLCVRTWRAGRRVMFCPHVVCRHAHRRHSVNPFGRAGWRHFQSLSRFVAKYHGLPQRPAVNSDRRPDSPA